MAWKARLKQVTADRGNPEAISIEVEYYDNANGRSFQKTENLHALNVNSRADVRAITDAHVVRLRELDRVKAFLDAAIGEDL
jgi:hypothetical protein